jgi:hypothetical protein
MVCDCEGSASEAGSCAVGCASLVTVVTDDIDDIAAWSGCGGDPAFASV